MPFALRWHVQLWRLRRQHKVDRQLCIAGGCEDAQSVRGSVPGVRVKRSKLVFSELGLK